MVVEVLVLLVVLSVYDQMIIQLSDWWWCGRGCSIQVYYCSVSTQQLLDFLLIGNDNCQPPRPARTHKTTSCTIQVSAVLSLLSLLSVVSIIEIVVGLEG